MDQAIAKLFAAGGSQAVSLPAEFRFEGTTEVYIRRDKTTGDVILSTRPPADWGAFIQLRQSLGSVALDGFMAAREQSSQQQDPFDGWNK